MTFRLPSGKASRLDYPPKDGIRVAYCDETGNLLHIEFRWLVGGDVSPSAIYVPVVEQS